MSKSVAQKKLQGTYRKDRDSKKESVENYFAQVMPYESDTCILPPDTITNDFVIQAYKAHTSMLVKLKLIQPSDIPQINMMFELLQEIYKIGDEIKKLDVIQNIAEYNLLSKQRLQMISAFNNMARLYYISPVARLKLQIDSLNVDKLKAESTTAIGKLLQKKNYE